MPVDTRIDLVLKNPIIMKVFTRVAKDRQVLFKDLIGSTAPDRDSVKRSLTTLKEANLIKEEPAPLIDFGRYYVTADGLRIERQLQLMGLDLG